MDTASLTRFVALAENLSFTRASAVAHVSPSSLTRSVQRLEAEVGVSLFERNNRSVRLTEAGERFLRYARDTLADWAQIQDALQQDAEGLRGELRIYCSVTASYSFLHEILARFRSQHPGVHLLIHTGAAEDALARIRGGSEDVAIAAKPRKIPAELAFRPIATTPLVFIAAADRTSDHITADRLAPHEQMIVSEHGVAREAVDAWRRRQPNAPPISAQVAGNEAIVSMVSLGYGVGVVPEIVLRNSPLANRVRIIDVRPALPPYDIGLVTLKRRLSAPVIRALWSQPA